MRRLLLAVLGLVGAWFLLAGLVLIVRVQTRPGLFVDADMLLGPPLVGVVLLAIAIRCWPRRG